MMAMDFTKKISANYNQLGNWFLKLCFCYSAVKEGNQYELGWPQSEGKREDTWPNDGYIVSKVGISAMTRIQQRQFLQDERKGLIINAVHPGYVNTDMTSFKGELTIEQGN